MCCIQWSIASSISSCLFTTEDSCMSHLGRTSCLSQDPSLNASHHIKPKHRMHNVMCPLFWLDVTWPILWWITIWMINTTLLNYLNQGGFFAIILGNHAHLCTFVTKKSWNGHGQGWGAATVLSFSIYGHLQFKSI